MILTDTEITKSIESGDIIIKPYDASCLGSNSYDVHLGEILAEYIPVVLDAKRHNEIHKYKIPPEGVILYPDKLYLGVIQEYTETHKHVPMLDGKSSTGRLGIDIHATAGKGDVGFCGNWTLEISVTMPVKVYAGMPIGQLWYLDTKGEVTNPYNKKQSAKYSNEAAEPVESMMFKNFIQ